MNTATSIGAPSNALRNVGEKFPNGSFLGYEIWKNDPTTPWIKTLWVVLTVIGLVYMIYSVSIIVNVVGMNDRWDYEHGLLAINHQHFLMALPELVAVTLDLSIAKVNAIFVISFGLYGMILLSDILLKECPDSIAKSPSQTHYPWPASWKTENTICYHEMFCEPTRWGSLLRRPGNSLSNVTYLLSSLCVFASSMKSIFRVSDVLFATMLLSLTVFSTLWHASNAPWSQYVDIWSMDCCILYLIVRYGCLGGQNLLTTFFGLESKSSQLIASTACFLLYAAIVASLAKHYWKQYRQRWLHGGCPFSGRARLLGRSNVDGKGQEDVHVLNVCAFAALPVFYTGIPTLIQVFWIGSVGSTTAASWVFRTLVLGWTYRLFDRWLLDGCILMNMCTVLPCCVSAIGTALVSPTAVLHFVTGLTLLTGYMHCRTVEDFVVHARD
jgi:hypothetical protein